MKTTVEIADPLLREAQRLARAKRTTVRALIEEGLRRVVADPNAGSAYAVPDTVVTGNGPSRWDEMSSQDRLEVMYGDRS